MRLWHLWHTQEDQGNYQLMPGSCWYKHRDTRGNGPTDQGSTSPDLAAQQFPVLVTRINLKLRHCGHWKGKVYVGLYSEECLAAPHLLWEDTIHQFPHRDFLTIRFVKNCFIFASCWQLGWLSGQTSMHICIHRIIVKNGELKTLQDCETALGITRPQGSARVYRVF